MKKPPKMLYVVVCAAGGTFWLSKTKPDATTRAKGQDDGWCRVCPKEYKHWVVAYARVDEK